MGKSTRKFNTAFSTSPAGEERSVNSSQKKIVLIMSGGGPAGVFIEMGLLEILHDYLLNKSEKLTSIVGCSAGSLVGAVYAIDPTTQGLKRAIMKMLETTPDGIFGRFHKLRRKWHELLFFVAPEMTNGFLSGEKYMSFLSSLFGDKKVMNTRIPFFALGYDIIAKVPVTNFIYLKTAVYISSAQPPEIPPLHNRFVDGGVMATIPVFLALKDEPDEIWIFNVSKANRPKYEIKGIREIVTESIDGFVAEEIKQSLALVPDHIHTYMVNGNDYPEIGDDFLSGFKFKKELYNYGVRTMNDYIDMIDGNPSGTTKGKPRYKLSVYPK